MSRDRIAWETAADVGCIQGEIEDEGEEETSSRIFGSVAWYSEALDHPDLTAEEIASLAASTYRDAKTNEIMLTVEDSP